MQKNIEQNNSFLDCQMIIEAAKQTLTGGMEKPNLFLMQRHSDELFDLQLSDRIYNHLHDEFPNHIRHAILPVLNKDLHERAYICIAVDSSRSEKVRDIIKEELWAARDDIGPAMSLKEMLAGSYKKTIDEFRIEDYGIYIPFRKTKPTAIRTLSFHHHPTFYRYRVATEHLAHIPESLGGYLEAIFTSCPNHLFKKQGLRASAVRKEELGFDIPIRNTSHHEIQFLAEASLSYEAVKSRHENLQKFFLERDVKTIACEVPVWVEHWELKEYLDIFGTHQNLTGHVDVLRYEDNNVVGVWDYKPNATEERNATVQVFLYALMLSLRTGLSLTQFVCGYFDERSTYIFKPCEVRFNNEH